MVPLNTRVQVARESKGVINGRFRRAHVFERHPARRIASAPRARHHPAARVHRLCVILHWQHLLNILLHWHRFVMEQ